MLLARKGLANVDCLPVACRTFLLDDDSLIVEFVMVSEGEFYASLFFFFGLARMWRKYAGF